MVRPYSDQLEMIHIGTSEDGSEISAVQLHCEVNNKLSVAATDNLFDSLFDVTVLFLCVCPLLEVDFAGAP